ncbi:CapA family protein [Candidatus Saccharibacteria bacterium]|nr:CapA family protein [Candidatus Saccharibacteria bacterium]
MNVRENVGQHSAKKPRVRLRFIVIALVGLLIAAELYALDRHNKLPAVQEEKVAAKLLFDQTITQAEQKTIRKKIVEQQKTPKDFASIKAVMSTSEPADASLLDIFVPVTSFNSARQEVGENTLSSEKAVYFSSNIDESIRSQLANKFGLKTERVKTFQEFSDLPDESVGIVPIDGLRYELKLLRLDGAYYLDEFTKGAYFRSAEFEGDGASQLEGLELRSFKTKDDTLKVNMTGVTALTRVMQKKLTSVGDPLYFSAKISEFLADADITHVSNEVSFRDGCAYSNTSFCSPPAFIETLKASGVDLVELTGNHNNDNGSEYNTNTINLYHELGWATVGGGLNAVEAAKPHKVDQKDSKVTFLAYNFADSPNGGAISSTNRAGANAWDKEKIKADIAEAKNENRYVIVDVQYWECYAYPNGFLEYPQCDKPIGDQEEDFKWLIDQGADMVIGTQAHQPQTYELYKNQPIYYGLGNLYFEQTSWPGTERGIILSHYFVDGQLLQTKLTPTVYDRDLQTRVMTSAEADYLLNRLRDARE